MKKVFGIGITGLIGSRMVELLQDKYEFKNLSVETGVDITNPDTLAPLREDKEHEVVILLAAKADVDGCELDKPLGENGAAWKINVEGARNVVEACQIGKKKLLYVSTDFVFNGEDTPDAGYTEEMAPHPVNWYGQTKHEAERVVQRSGIPYCIVRPAYPYRSPFQMKKDFVQGILPRLKDKLPLAGVTDHIMTPTLVDDFARCIDAVIANQCIGTYHTVGNQSLSPYDAILLIGKVFGLPTDHVTKTTRDEYFKNKAPRPSNLTMNNDRIEQLGVKMKTFEEGLFELKKQL